MSIANPILARRFWIQAGGALLAIALVAPACAPSRQLAASQSSFAPPAPPIEVATGNEAANLVAAFEAGSDELYRLGAGDEINIDVWDRAEVSGKHVIGPDGRITLPVVGELQLSDLTREEAANAVTRQLRTYLRGPIVTVRVDRYVAQRVFILGRVTNPGAISFDQPPTLLETISRAGVLPTGGSAEKAALSRCAIFRGRDRVLWVDLKNLLNGTNLALNVRLKRNDTVYIPDSDDQLVYALGDVLKPGAFQLRAGMTIMDLLALAGGPSEQADASRLAVIRTQGGERREFSLQQLLDPASNLDAALAEGDVLFAPRRGLAKLGYVLNRVSPLTGFLLLSSSLTP